MVERVFVVVLHHSSRPDDPIIGGVFRSRERATAEMNLERWKDYYGGIHESGLDGMLPNFNDGGASSK